MTVNWYRWLIATAYGLIETAYFGWNMWPGSDAEIIASGITFLIFALAVERKTT